MADGNERKNETEEMIGPDKVEFQVETEDFNLHKVQDGDTLEQLAHTFQIHEEIIRSAINKLKPKVGRRCNRPQKP